MAVRLQYVVIMPKKIVFYQVKKHVMCVAF